MGLLIDYFLASADEQAAAVVDWPSGPAKGTPKKGLVGKALPGLPTVQGPGIEPVVNLGMFEELHTGKAFGEQLKETEPRWVVGFEGVLGALLAAVDRGVVTSIHGGVEQRHGLF